MTIITTGVDLLRHGEAQGGSCYRGITDDALSSTGWEQMTAKAASQAHWDIIICSPLIRCQAFAESLATKLQRPLISIPALQEIDFGDWEGKTAAQIDADLLEKFYANPTELTPPNGEHFIDFQRRVLTAWQMLLKQHQGKQICLITHAGVIRIILAQILGMNTQHSFRLKIGHACLSRVECFHDNKSADFIQLVQHG
ncbi:MAG: phosphoglycerate mutase [Methyloprofundus sp.]|nr:phosphoglycerate mutase [Methyloprofundus sp.]